MLKVNEKTRRVEQSGRGPSVSAVGSPSAQMAFVLRNLAHSIWWTYHKQQLDIIQLVADSDRRHEIARTQSLKLINEGEKVLMQAINNLLMNSTPESKEG